MSKNDAAAARRKSTASNSRGQPREPQPVSDEIDAGNAQPLLDASTPQPLPPEPQAAPIITSDDYTAATGEALHQTLDLNTWGPADRLMEAFARLEQEIHDATADERVMVRQVRNVVFPKIKSRPGAPPQAGVYRATLDDIRRVQAAVLFNGQVEACDGISVLYDTLPLTIVQIGVSLVAYRADQSTWSHRLYRRDMRVRGRTTVEEEVMEFLDRRQRRSGLDQPSQRDQMSDLFRRAIMAFAERAVLADRSTAAWRVGHGNPLAHELITGSGSAELILRSLEVLKRLVLEHERFLFVPSAPAERAFLTIGNALEPLEYAVIDTAADRLNRTIEQGGYRGQEFRNAKHHLEEFAEEAGPKVLMGVYRVSRHAPAQAFFAHADHVCEAALVAIADSILQDHRGFPMLLDLADRLCGNLMGPETLLRPAVAAYADAGEPLRYQPERNTRR